MQNSSVDPLTHLFTHRYLLTELERTCLYSARDGSHFGVLMIDVDGFKSINDNFGFAVGDSWLQALASTIQATAERNIVSRFGGDEFVILMRGASEQKALELAESIRANAAKVTVDHQKESVGPLTLTIGVACFPDDGATALELLKEADLALVIGKKNGKNRVLPARNPLRRDAPPY